MFKRKVVQVKSFSWRLKNVDKKIRIERENWKEEENCAIFLVAILFKNLLHSIFLFLLPTIFFSRNSLSLSSEKKTENCDLVDESRDIEFWKERERLDKSRKWKRERSRESCRRVTLNFFFVSRLLTF